MNQATGMPRTPQDLMGELQLRGTTTIEATHQLNRLGAILFLAISPIPLILGLAGLGFGVAVPDTTLLIIGLFSMLIGAGGLVAGLTLRRRSRNVRGAVWTVDTRGITIDGVGPVPWGDLEAPTHRFEPNPYDDGYQRALVMPLTDAGRQRALALDPTSRRIINVSVRDTVFFGPKPLKSVRIPAMKEMSGGDFAGFLENARRFYGGGAL